MRTLVFIPQVLSGVIVAFIWRSILTQDGLLNVGAGQISGITDAADLVDRHARAWRPRPICVVVSWMTIAFATVVYTASLQSVPAELYEAARMDGAGVARPLPARHAGR